MTGKSEIQKMSGNVCVCVCVSDHDTRGVTGGRQSMKHAHTETKETARKSRATVMSGKERNSSHNTLAVLSSECCSSLC